MTDRYGGGTPVAMIPSTVESAAARSSIPTAAQAAAAAAAAAAADVIVVPNVMQRIRRMPAGAGLQQTWTYDEFLARCVEGTGDRLTGGSLAASEPTAPYNPRPVTWVP